MKWEMTIQGLEELKRAIARNPEYVVKRTREFLVRGIAAYKQVIIRNPWSVGASGGGVPVRTGHLRDTHVSSIGNLEARIGPDQQAAPYAAAVHGIEGYPRKRSYKLRPWLDYTKITASDEIERLQGELLTDIRDQLAK